MFMAYTRWFKYDRDYLCVNKSQFVPVILEPPCTIYSESDKVELVESRQWHKQKGIYDVIACDVYSGGRQFESCSVHRLS